MKCETTSILSQSYWAYLTTKTSKTNGFDIIEIDLVNPVVDQSFNNYIWLRARSFFWFSWNNWCDCDRVKTESTSSLLTKDLVEVWQFNCCKIWSLVFVFWETFLLIQANYIPVIRVGGIRVPHRFLYVYPLKLM